MLLFQPSAQVHVPYRCRHSFVFKICRYSSDWKLIIGAVGEETERLKHLVNTLNLAPKVKFVGWLDKERNFYYYSIAKFWYQYHQVMRLLLVCWKL